MGKSCAQGQGLAICCCVGLLISVMFLFKNYNQSKIDNRQ